MPQVKVLLVQLLANGDCLFATVIAKQIKEVDFPGCHLTWMIGSRFNSILKNNPFVDGVIEIPIKEGPDFFRQRNLIPQYIAEAGGSEKYDQIFVTDKADFNDKNWFGSIRSSIFRCYPRSLRIDPQPLVFLDDLEVQRVKDYCDKNKLTSGSYNILFECSPQSGQSLMNPERAKDIAEQVTAINPNVKFVLSSNIPVKSGNPNIINGSELTWRENAELSKYCHLLLGCSSGISWLCTSNWARKLPTLQVINPGYMGGRLSASMKADFLYFGLNTDHIIELYNATDDVLTKCVLMVCTGDFIGCKTRYDKKGYRFFNSHRFLKESKISSPLKPWIWLRYILIEEILRLYRFIKPNWFTPKIWWAGWKNRAGN